MWSDQSMLFKWSPATPKYRSWDRSDTEFTPGNDEGQIHGDESSNPVARRNPTMVAKWKVILGGWTHSYWMLLIHRHPWSSMTLGQVSCQRGLEIVLPVVRAGLLPRPIDQSLNWPVFILVPGLNLQPCFYIICRVLCCLPAPCLLLQVFLKSKYNQISTCVSIIN